MNIKIAETTIRKDGKVLRRTLKLNTKTLTSNLTVMFGAMFIGWLALSMLDVAINNLSAHGTISSWNLIGIMVGKFR